MGASCCISALFTSKKGLRSLFCAFATCAYAACLPIVPAPHKSPMLALVGGETNHPFRKTSCQHETFLQELGGFYQNFKRAHLVEDIFHHACTEMYITLSSTRSEHPVYINCQACNAKIGASLIALRHIQTCTLPETNTSAGKLVLGISVLK